MPSLEQLLLAFQAGTLTEGELREQMQRFRDGTLPTPVSYGQEGLWLEHQRHPDSSAYNLRAGLRFPIAIDPDRLRRACELTIERHPILQSVFGNVDGVPCQHVDRALPLSFSHRDWSAGTYEAALAYLDEESRRPFNVERGPLFRVTLLTRGARESLLLLAVHHLIFDGGSWPSLVLTLLAAYDGAPVSDLAAVGRGVEYRNFVEWERTFVDAPTGRADRAYWIERLRGPLPHLELPFVAPAAAAEPSRQRSYVRRLEARIFARVHAACRQCRVGPAVFLLAVYQALVYRYTGESDLIVGVPTMVRPHAKFERTIGFFVNMVAVRVRIAPGCTFMQLLATARDAMADGLDHASYPFSRVVRDLGVSGDQSPVFQVAYSYQSASLFGGRASAPAAVPFELIQELNQEGGFGDYALALEVNERADGWDLRFKYDTTRIDAVSIAQAADHLLHLVDAALEEPATPVGHAALLTPRELAELVEWNATARSHAGDACIHLRFEAQVRRTPEATALESGGETVSYPELNRRANRLARYLRAHHARRETRVALCLDRGADVITGWLAVLKAGAAYVPLDPNYPAERLAYMATDAAPTIVLTHERLRHRLSSVEASIISIDAQQEEWAALDDGDLPPSTDAARPEDLAYVIYTSGSTGTPKAIGMPHRALANLLAWQEGELSDRDPPRTLQFAALSFDVAFQEAFAALCVGGTLVLIPETTRGDPAALHRALSAARISRLYLPFTALQRLAEVATTLGPIPTLQDVVTAGEALRVTAAVRSFFQQHPGCRLHNQYGPSETHVATALTLPQDPVRWPDLPPIGRPIANTHIYLLDRHGQPVPRGHRGEVVIGGACVARGYLNRPGLTAERFLPDAFEASAGARVYHTGDLAVLDEAGQLQFLGRNDDQVKIRGFRLELGEVEAYLMQHPGVRQAVAVVREDVPGDQRLVAYIIESAPGSVAVDGMRAALQAKLPQYMVPSAFVKVTAFSLTPSGKLDRRALPAPDLAAYVLPAFTPPQGPTEETLAALWQDLLQAGRVGRNDSFFDLGGHSLLAMQLVVRLRERLGIDLPPSVIFDHQDVAALAQYIEMLGRARAVSSPRTSEAGAGRQRGVL